MSNDYSCDSFLEHEVSGLSPEPREEKTAAGGQKRDMSLDTTSFRRAGEDPGASSDLSVEAEAPSWDAGQKRADGRFLNPDVLYEERVLDEEDSRDLPRESSPSLLSPVRQICSAVLEPGAESVQQESAERHEIVDSDSTRARYDESRAVVLRSLPSINMSVRVMVFMRQGACVG